MRYLVAMARRACEKADAGRVCAGLWLRPLLEGGELLSCVLREAIPRNLAAEGAFVISGTGVQQEPGEFTTSMRLCVSARLADADEVRSYRAWRRSKGSL